MTNSPYDPGSFRDRTARVFYHNGSVFRGLNQHAWYEWERLRSTIFFGRAVDEGKIVATAQADPAELPKLVDDFEQRVLKHETIPFVSYPYEWPFGMLKDAALLQLELLASALEEDMILKDSSSFNVQWVGTRPVFIDIPSFRKLSEGEPWIGYRQFCQLFLYPLFLQAYKNIPFQTWLRGNLDGIEPEQCQQLMSFRDYFRRGVFSHVFLQAKAQSQFAHTNRDVRDDLRKAGFDVRLIKANIKSLQALVERLEWTKEKSTWSEYTSNNSYDSGDSGKKVSFVRDSIGSRNWQLVWDLGCNTGTFSQIAAERARHVIALDADQLAVERFYQTLKLRGSSKILPLVCNIADPSPNLGWRGLERKELVKRGQPDLVLCLALIHHLVLTANIPLEEFIGWLSDLGSNLIIEFITKQDPMVRQLLRNKDDIYKDYEQEYFERCLSARFSIVRQETFNSETRIIYHAVSKQPHQ